MKELIRKTLKKGGSKKYFFNTSWMFFEKILRILSSLLIGAWLARYLNPDGYGIYSYTIAFTSIFGGVAQLGLHGIVVRDLVKGIDKKSILLGTVFRLRLYGAIISILIIALILIFANLSSTIKLYILIISSAQILGSFDVIQFYFESQVQGKIISICKIIQLFLSSLLKIYLIIAEADLLFFVLVFVIDAFSLALSYTISFKIQAEISFFKYFDFTIAKRLLRDSWPLILSSLIVTIYMKIDQIMIRSMLGEASVGLYSVSVKLSEALYFMPVLITSSLFPAIINARFRDLELYNRRLSNLYSLLIYLGIIITILTIITSDWIIYFLFGPSYQQSSELLRIHIMSFTFVSLGVASSKWFLVENKQILSFFRTFSGLLVNIVLNCILIPYFGLKGAALSTFFGQFTASYLFDLLNKSTQPMFIMKSRALLGFNFFQKN